MNDINALVKSVQTAMTEIDNKPKPKTKAVKPTASVVDIAENPPPRRKPAASTKPKAPRITLDELNGQPKQAKTVRLPIKLCEELEKAKHWQCLEGKTPNTEQDIITQAVLDWIGRNGRTNA